MVWLAASIHGGKDIHDRPKLMTIDFERQTTSLKNVAFLKSVVKSTERFDAHTRTLTNQPFILAVCCMLSSPC